VRKAFTLRADTFYAVEVAALHYSEEHFRVGGVGVRRGGGRKMRESRVDFRRNKWHKCVSMLMASHRGKKGIK
jgi:hypothetical protein